MYKYINKSGISCTINGVKFSPNEVKEVPFIINKNRFYCLGMVTSDNKSSTTKPFVENSIGSEKVQKSSTRKSENSSAVSTVESTTILETHTETTSKEVNN